MYLDDFSQEYLVDSLDELEILLKKRFLEGVNFFIYYLEEEVQYISKGKASEGIEVFVEDIYGTEVFLSKNKVLTIDEFYRIAQSFFETQARPDFIEWEKI